MSFLNEADQNYREAKVYSRFEIPGDYNVKVKKIKINEEKKYVGWNLEILDGEFAGEQINVTHFFSKKSIWRYKQDMHNIGFKIQPSKFPSYIEKIVGILIKVRLTVTNDEMTGKVYTNCSFIENLDKDNVPEFAPKNPQEVESIDDPF